MTDISENGGDGVADRTGELLRAAVDTAEALGRVSVQSVTDPRDKTLAHFVVSRDGVAALSAGTFDAYRDKPLRREGMSRHTRLESFIKIVERFKASNSAIFAKEDPASPSVTAVFDYHPGDPDNAAAAFGAHKATYSFPLSPEWQAWFGKNAVPMTMAEFATFLEDHIVDVLAEPGELGEVAQRFISTTGGKMATPTKLIEIARGLQINESSVVKEARNLSTGEAEITFDSVHTGADGKPIRMPNLFVIAIPVFTRAEVSYRLVARLRYRKNPGGLIFWFELWRPDLVFTDAFEEAIQTVRVETDLPVFLGSPEA